ncbi:MAG: DUF296 domain-containing protein [Desulfurococcales archaeon]|nr:DUF296 domain-containing protein [Desulfurococcales archaeon]
MPEYEMVHGATGRIFFVKILEEASPHRAIEEFLADNGIEFAVIKGIGGMAWARLGVFSPDENKYYVTDVEAEPARVLEVVSLIGNSVRGPDGSYYTHLHATLAKSPDKVYAGHLVDGRVRPFLELTVIELVGAGEEARRLLAHRWGTRS